MDRACSTNRANRNAYRLFLVKPDGKKTTMKTKT
jgi:hypothetical protein